ncbi:SH3 domain-containing protein [Pseudoroseomonas globiformis]|uniref:SH3 domain-containing protein n=1 Tax=Teichococcus globiformis TaxID=2307229 RepID=A0ABV7FYV4_9PROT
MQAPPSAPARPASVGAGPDARSPAVRPQGPSLPPDPALTGEYGPQPSVSEQRRAILPEAARVLESPEVERAYGDFLQAAIELSHAGMVFEMVHRPDPMLGALVPREPRNLTVSAVPEAALGKEAQTVVLMGVGFWEFLPGFFFGSDRIIDGRRMAMDVGSFRFTENSPSGDAEIIGHSENGPLAQYMRIDISGDGLVKSLAVSNVALGGAFVAAYRAYIEALAGYPYKLLHPYRQLSLPVQAPAPVAQPAERPSRPLQPAARAVPAAAAPRRSRAIWGWLAVPPLIGLAFFLGSLTTGGGSDGPQPSSPPQPQPVAPAQQSPATASPPVLAPVPEVALSEQPPVVEDPNGLPMPPPPAPPAPPRSAGATEAPSESAAAPPVIQAPGPRNLTLPGEAQPPAAGAAATAWRPGAIRQAANLRAAAFGGSPVLRVLPAGTPVRIVEESEGWLRLTSQEGESLGWVYNTLVR